MSGMTTYFIRRLLLVPVTFLLITLMVYAILRKVPGGPIEQAETAMKLAAASGEAGGGGGGLGDEAGLQLDEDAMRELERYYSLDQPTVVGYAQWLGVVPRESLRRVPPVPEGDHEEVVARLRQAQAAVEQAEAALAEAVTGDAIVERDGDLWRGIDEAEVAEDLREEARRLHDRTFGERHPVRARLAPEGLAFTGSTFLRRVEAAEAGPDAAARLEDLRRARAAEATVETETGYYLDGQGKPVQLAFRPLLALNEVRGEATKRLEAMLGPRGHIVYLAKVYRVLTDEERDAPERKEFFADAETLVRAGFGKRDELLAHLGEDGYTWRKGTYYRRLEEEKRKEDESFFETVDALVAARHLANAELTRARDEFEYEVTEEGRIYKVETGRNGVFQLDFGQSYTYNEPVLGLIGSKMEVSIQFGLIGYFLTWLVCIPLGVFKAIKHRTWFDSATSVAVFLGYSIPGFVLCLILLSTLAVNFEFFPLGGYKPPNIDELSWGEAVIGRIRHMIIPVAGYMIGQFAAMTILMKNSLLENLGQDYVRTAFAKGLREKRVIFVHALRNSLIPITAGIGHALGLLFAGSFLIEKTCNIDGMGLLGFHAVLQRDYPIILGMLVILVLIRLTGNIFSDIIWALIDPRIRFGK